MGIPLSILDLAQIGPGETAAESFATSVELARAAETGGYLRVWYAEHHNMPSIASSAPAVLIAHVAAHTESIRLGAGGVMLPNHAPLTIAEQFGALATLHPGRIDLGVGRAPGGDQATFAALRRTVAAADRFPADVLELQGYLRGESRVEGVRAIPGDGTNVPIYILGSSLFGAQLAAALGLPYAFASHFAPQALEQAISLYRKDFQPSEQLSEPYVIAGVSAIVDDDPDVAREQARIALRQRVNALFGRERRFTDEEADMILEMPQGQQIHQMMRYTGVGTPAEVRTHLDWFAGHSAADELMVAAIAPARDVRLRTVEYLAPARSVSD